MSQQRVDDLQSIEWLDKRIYDLQLSREIAIQAAPQIRLIQQTNRNVSGKNSIFCYDDNSVMAISNFDVGQYKQSTSSKYGKQAANGYFR